MQLRQMLVLLCIFGITAREVINRVEVFFIEELISGHTFSYRIDTIDGKKRETWTVNGDQVEHDAYEDAITQAQLAELHNKRDAERQKKLNDIEQSHALRCMLAQKIVRLMVQDIEVEYEKIQDERLRPYYAFGYNSFESQAELDTLQHTLAKVRQQLQESVEYLDIKELEKLPRILEQYPSRLHILHQATIKNAIALCDDTRFLKELFDTM